MAAWWLTLCRLAALVAISVSTALYVQYIDPAATSFCALDSGCEAVRSSGLSYYGSRYASLPLAGVVGFVGLLVLSFRPASSALFVRAATFGAAVALVLLVVQAAVIGAFCSLCVVVDVAGIAVAVSAVLGRKVAPREACRPTAWVALAVVALAAPPLWAAVKPAPPVPEVIRELYEPGKINVIEFADFECPHCRALHPALKSAMEPYRDRIHFERLNVPLEMHPFAEPAACAYICAERQGAGEEMADRLFSMELSRENIRRAAVGLGVDPDLFDRCVADPDTSLRIQSETRILEEAGMRGLPTTYIEGKRFLGSVGEAALRDAIDRAAQGDSGSEGIPGPVYVALVALSAAVIAWFGRTSRANLPNA